MIRDGMSFLVVCYGNICRSPMAQGVLEHLARASSLSIHVDSAGINGWHVGAQPDPRAMISAARRGIDITNQRSREIVEADYHRFDHILAVDRRVFSVLRLRAPDGRRARLGMLMELVEGADLDVPDPYYEDQAAFERAFDMIERGAHAQIHRDTLIPAGW